MKELNNFRNFLNEDLDEGVMDKLKKFGKKVKDVADKMDGGDDHGGIFHNVPGGKPTPRNQKEELKKTQEGEVHEGTWGYGSKDSMIKALAQLEKIRKMGGVKGSLELDKLDNMLYRIFGDDTFHDAIDRAKDGAIDDDSFANAIGDAQARGVEMLKFHDESLEEDEDTGEAVDADYDLEESFIGDLATRIRKRKAAKKEKERFTKGLDMKMGGAPEIDPEFTKGLGENDSVLDEIIDEGTVFDEIDKNMKLIAVHMSAADALEDLAAEFQIISGGTKILAQALKNIVRDNNLTGDAEEYASIGFEE